MVVTAYAEQNGSYVTVEYYGDIKPAPAQNGTPGEKVIEVRQMDTVYWGDVCDLRLVEGWYGKLVHKDSGRIVDISSFTKRIKITPETFPVGEWDQWSDFDFDEDHGNTIAFYVAAFRPIPNESAPPENRTLLNPYIQPVPRKHVADFLVAHGDTFNISVSEGSIWIFGRTEGYYDLPTENNTLVLNATQIEYLTPGNYVLLTEQPGLNSINVDMRYDREKDRIEYFDPVNFKIEYLDLFGLDPRTRLDKFREIEGRTNDTYTEYDLVVEDPYVEIISLDQSYFRNDSAAQTIRGYTNVAIGTPMTAVIDEDKQIGKSLKYSTFKMVAHGDPTKPGDMRWFEISIPLLFENFAAGPHTITVRTALGGMANVNYNVYETPEHSYIPNNTIKYINGSEWRPDPTPIIITEVVTKEIIVTETILIPVTPSQESVEQGQFEALKTIIINGAIILALLFLIGFALWYLVYSFLRLRAQGKK